LLFGFSLPGLDVWHEDDAAATVTVQQSQKQKQSQQQQQPPQPQPLSVCDRFLCILLFSGT
jgi:hypothetical protein